MLQPQPLSLSVLTPSWPRTQAHQGFCLCDTCHCPSTGRSHSGLLLALVLSVPEFPLSAFSCFFSCIHLFGTQALILSLHLRFTAGKVEAKGQATQPLEEPSPPSQPLAALLVFLLQTIVWLAG